MNEIEKKYAYKYQFYNGYLTCKEGNSRTEFILEFSNFLEIFDHNVNEIKRILNNYNFVFHDFEVELSYKKDVILYSHSNIEINHVLHYYKKFGYLPLSLELFYNKFEQIDFRGFFEDIDYNFGLDPLTFIPPSSIIELNREPFEDNFIRNEETEKIGLVFSLDEYLKENMSGGGGYSIDLSKQQMLDDNINHYKQKISLINYLRLNIYYGCFPNISFYFDEISVELKDYLSDVNNKIIEF